LAPEAISILEQLVTSKESLVLIFEEMFGTEQAQDLLIHGNGAIS